MKTGQIDTIAASAAFSRRPKVAEEEHGNDLPPPRSDRDYTDIERRWVAEKLLKIGTRFPSAAHDGFRQWMPAICGEGFASLLETYDRMLPGIAPADLPDFAARFNRSWWYVLAPGEYRDEIADVDVDRALAALGRFPRTAPPKRPNPVGQVSIARKPRASRIARLMCLLASVAVLIFPPVTTRIIFFTEGERKTYDEQRGFTFAGSFENHPFQGSSKAAVQTDVDWPRLAYILILANAAALLFAMLAEGYREPGT